MPISNKMNAFHFSAYFNYNKYIFRFISSKEIKKLNEKNHKNIYHPEYIKLLKKICLCLCLNHYYNQLVFLMNTVVKPLYINLIFIYFVEA